MARKPKGREMGHKNVQATGLSILDKVEKKLDKLLQDAVDVLDDTLKGEQTGALKVKVALELVKLRVPNRAGGDSSTNIQLVFGVPRPGQGEVIEAEAEEIKELETKEE